MHGVLLCAVALLLAPAALANHVAEADAATLLQRLDLKNYKKFASARTDTSTDSSDSSSDAKRIARAVEAALKEVELAEQLATPTPTAASNIGLFRLRLSTTNEAQQCTTFSCADEYTAVNSAATVAAALNGASVDVVTTAGTFTARFNANAIATNANDQFQFTVAAASTAGNEVEFVLSTIAGEDGVNVTRIDVISQGTNRAVQQLVYFDPLGSAFWDDETNRDDATDQLILINGTRKIGCNPSFDANPQNFGVTQFGVRNSTDAFLVSNATESGPLEFRFRADLFALATAELPAVYNATGLHALPCGVRARAIYDEITIVTKRANDIQFGDDTLEHPLIYDAVSAQSRSLTPNYDSVIRELQLAAGRTQLRLRDITLDRGAFSILSRNSKFTPCFRVYPDEDFEIEVFIAMRGVGSATISGGPVRALLTPTDAPNLVNVDDVAGNSVTPFDELSPVPQFNVTEIDFILPSFGGVPVSEANNEVVVEGTVQRPFIQLRSDVTVNLEGCPEFTYFK